MGGRPRSNPQGLTVDNPQGLQKITLQEERRGEERREEPPLNPQGAAATEKPSGSEAKAQAVGASANDCLPPPANGALMLEINQRLMPLIVKKFGAPASKWARRDMLAKLASMYTEGGVAIKEIEALIQHWPLDSTTWESFLKSADTEGLRQLRRNFAPPPPVVATPPAEDQDAAQRFFASYLGPEVDKAREAADQAEAKRWLEQKKQEKAAKLTPPAAQ